MLSFL
jgi:nuclear mRNA export protein SAC3